MMKTFIVPAIALAAASVAVPAAAQSLTVSISSGQAYSQQYRGDRYDRDNRGWQPIAQRKYNLDRRIDQGVRSRQLSQREAYRLKSELNQLVRLEYGYQRGGLTQRERRDLDRRYDRLSSQVREERRDWDDRRR